MAASGSSGSGETEDYWEMPVLTPEVASAAVSAVDHDDGTVSRSHPVPIPSSNHDLAPSKSKLYELAMN